MRQHSTAADLPKPPHLAKETAAAGTCGCAEARPEETPAAAPAGHLMHESAMDWVLLLPLEETKGGGAGAGWRGGEWVLSGVSTGAEEQRLRRGGSDAQLLRSPRGRRAGTGRGAQREKKNERAVPLLRWPLLGSKMQEVGDRPFRLLAATVRRMNT
jgi:hypothetical protein